MPRPQFNFLTNAGVDLLNVFLRYNPAARVTARQAWTHPYFSAHPLPDLPELMPLLPDRGTRTKRARDD